MNHNKFISYWNGISKNVKISEINSPPFEMSMNNWIYWKRLKHSHCVLKWSLEKCQDIDLKDTLQTSHRWTDGYNRSGINYLGTSCGLFWGNWLYDHLVITLVPLWEHFGAIWWLLSDHWRSVLLPCRQHLWPFYYMCEFEKHISVSVPGKL